MSDKYENLHRAIKAQLSLWQQNHAALEPVIQSAPLLYGDPKPVRGSRPDRRSWAWIMLAFWEKWQNNEPLNLDSTFYQKQKTGLGGRRKTPRAKWNWW